MRKLSATQKNLVFNEMLKTETESVDLNTCKEGDILITSRGCICRYVKPLAKLDYFDHQIEYADGSKGTRTNDGYVFKKNRLETDHNIVKIIHI